MQSSKRRFLKLSAAATALASSTRIVNASGEQRYKHTKSSTSLSSIVDDVKPITASERKARIAKAQRLMVDHKIDAIILEPGSAMLYFTGISWWRSERLTAVIIPKEGDFAVVTPEFEEPSVRESMTFGNDVRIWNEHQNPFERVLEVLADRGIKNCRLGLEPTVRYFVVDGLQNLSNAFDICSALAITQGCRMFKSAHEIALMRKANEVTLTAYNHVYTNLDAGMPDSEVKSMMAQAQAELGGSSIWNMALCGPASAYPHGSKKPQSVKEGGVVLMDCGCSIHGYQSDISRTFVYGEASKHQYEAWNTVCKGQQIAFETAQLGTPAGAVDDAVRGYYEKLGYGPGYKTPV